jgi:hypothetical protein
MSKSTRHNVYFTPLGGTIRIVLLRNAIAERNKIINQ